MDKPPFFEICCIAESKNDCQILEKLVASEIEEKIADVSFLDAGGVESIKYPFFLLKELQIPFSIVVVRELAKRFGVNWNKCIRTQRYGKYARHTLTGGTFIFM